MEYSHFKLLPYLVCIWIHYTELVFSVWSILLYGSAHTFHSVLVCCMLQQRRTTNYFCTITYIFILGFVCDHLLGYLEWQFIAVASHCDMRVPFCKCHSTKKQLNMWLCIALGQREHHVNEIREKMFFPKKQKKCTIAISVDAKPTKN